MTKEEREKIENSTIYQEMSREIDHLASIMTAKELTVEACKYLSALSNKLHNRFDGKIRDPEEINPETVAEDLAVLASMKAIKNLVEGTFEVGFMISGLLKEGKNDNF